MPLSREAVRFGVVPGIADLLSAVARSSAQVRTARINADREDQDRAHRDRVAGLTGFKSGITASERRARTGDVSDAIGALNAPSEQVDLGFIPSEGLATQPFREDDTVSGRASVLNWPSADELNTLGAVDEGVVVRPDMFAAGIARNFMRNSPDTIAEAEQVSAVLQQEALFQGANAAEYAAFAQNVGSQNASPGKQAEREQLIGIQDLTTQELRDIDPRKTNDRLDAEQRLRRVTEALGQNEQHLDAMEQLRQVHLDPLVEGDKLLKQVAKHGADRINAAAGQVAHPLSVFSYESALADLSEELGDDMTIGAKQDLDKAIIIRIQRNEPYYKAMNDIDPKGQLGTTRLNVDINDAVVSWSGKQSDVGVIKPVVTHTATGLMQKDNLLTRTQAEAMGVLIDHMSVNSKVARALVSGDTKQVNVAFANMTERGRFHTGGGKRGAVEKVLEAFGTRTTPTRDRDPITGVVLPEPGVISPALRRDMMNRHIIIDERNDQLQKDFFAATRFGRNANLKEKSNQSPLRALDSGEDDIQGVLIQNQLTPITDSVFSNTQLIDIQRALKETAE